MDHPLDAGQRLRNSKGTEVGSPEHNQAPATFTIAVTQALPEIVMTTNKIQTHQSSHGMGHEMYGLAAELLANEARQRIGRLIDVSAPVISEPLDIPTCAQP